VHGQKATGQKATKKLAVNKRPPRQKGYHAGFFARQNLGHQIRC